MWAKPTAWITGHRSPQRLKEVWLQIGVSLHSTSAVRVPHHFSYRCNCKFFGTSGLKTDNEVVKLDDELSGEQNLGCKIAGVVQGLTWTCVNSADVHGSSDVRSLWCDCKLWSNACMNVFNTCFFCQRFATCPTHEPPWQLLSADFLSISNVDQFVLHFPCGPNPQPGSQATNIPSG